MATFTRDFQEQEGGPAWDWYVGHRDDKFGHFYQSSEGRYGEANHAPSHQLPNPESEFQVYGARNIEWDIMPGETPARSYSDCAWLPGYVSTAQSSSLYDGCVDTLDLPADMHSATPCFQNISTHVQRVESRESAFAESLNPERSRLAPAAFCLAAPGCIGPTTAANTESSNDPSPCENGMVARRQRPRFAGDEYTAIWVRGEGYDRAGWCSKCSSWHKLKDSAYWYHMHYSHGISFTTGRPFDLPIGVRVAEGTLGHEVLCGSCQQWVLIGRIERWRTPYFRHAHKCQVKNKPSVQKTYSRSKSGSPRKLPLRPPTPR